MPSTARQGQVPRPRAGAVAYLFDLDGLLVDTESASLESWVIGAARLGLSIDEDLFASLTGTTVEAADALLEQTIGEADVVQALRAARNSTLKRLLAERPPRPMPGARELVTALEPAPRAVVTSSAEETARRNLRAAGFSPRSFRFLLCAGDYRASKPDPEPYRKAMDRMDGCAETFVAFEDSLNGVQSAAAAGARTVHVLAREHASACQDAGAALCIPTLHDFLPCVDPSLAM